MSKYEEKIKALKMRREGCSLKEIAQELDVSKSTVSLWCRDILLSERQADLLAERSLLKTMKGRQMGAETNRQKKRTIIAQTEKEAAGAIGIFSERDLLIAATCLFWGEGAKTASRFIFINSDIMMIKIMMAFLDKIAKVDPARIRITIQINSVHEYRIRKITKYWSDNLSVPLSQFDKPNYIRVIPKKVYENFENYYGIVRLKVLHGSVLQYRMLGLIKALEKADLPG